MKDNGWDEGFLRGLHKLSLEEAKRQVVDLINAGSTRPSKKAHLIRDIMRVKSSAEVSRIMYNALLAGSGLGVQGSDWQRLHGAAP